MAVTAQLALLDIRRRVSVYDRSPLCVGVFDADTWLQHLIDTGEFGARACCTGWLELGYDPHTHHVAPVPQTNRDVAHDVHSTRCPWVVVPVSIDLLRTGVVHANVLVVNRAARVVELFEPLGYHRPPNDVFNAGLVKGFLEWYVPILLGDPSYTVVSKCGACDVMVEAWVDDHQLSRCRRMPLGVWGYCAVYVAIYAHLRLLAPRAKQREVVAAMLDLPAVELLDLVLRYISWQQSDLGGRDT